MSSKRAEVAEEVAEASTSIRRAIAALAESVRRQEGDDVVESHELTELCKPFARTILEAS